MKKILTGIFFENFLPENLLVPEFLFPLDFFMPETISRKNFLGCMMENTIASRPG
jgi:hypothetical protein